MLETFNFQNQMVLIIDHSLASDGTYSIHKRNNQNQQSDSNQQPTSGMLAEPLYSPLLYQLSYRRGCASVRVMVVGARVCWWRKTDPYILNKLPPHLPSTLMRHARSKKSRYESQRLKSAIRSCKKHIGLLWSAIQIKSQN